MRIPGKTNRPTTQIRGENLKKIHGVRLIKILAKTPKQIIQSTMETLILGEIKNL
jgi:hypothetical protein